MKRWMKIIRDKVADHLVGAVIASVLAAFVAFFWKWFKTQHSLQLFGWLWVLIVLIIAIAPASFVFLMNRQKTHKRRQVLTNEIDIRNSLKQWFEQRYTEDFCHLITQEVIHFSSLDEKLGLIPGSARRYLEDVVKESFYWRTMNEGQDTVEIRRI